MLLQLATWPEVETYLESSTAVVVPIGSTEQHGPNGLIGTDAICAETIAREMSSRIDVLVGPTLAVGMAQHHLAFPGSIALKPSTLLALVRDVVESLLCHGFSHLYFLNGHGGNVATVGAAFSEVWSARSFAGSSRATPRLRLRNWWTGARVMALSAELFGDAEGSHATPSEVSLSWYAHADAVKDVSLTPEQAPDGVIRDAADYRRLFPDGRIGSNPGLASVAHGERILAAALEDALEDFQRFTEAD
ncbi:MAG TPA: amidase [Gammaproteobacteria bacterium]|jgi:creatinine amidohydrolase|nr:amidase [Acidiferrobacteraceae bacterium]HCV19942.1 amidase [Gammaproteobacteria bacterium]|tara:strand:+ start:841 stop:1584 length:744 start_codon:yes stop_codon:yes gene_type:complete